MEAKQSSTRKRLKSFYPTPQNEIRLKKVVVCADGSKKDGVSMNKILNEALNQFFTANPNYNG